MENSFLIILTTMAKDLTASHSLSRSPLILGAYDLSQDDYGSR